MRESFDEDVIAAIATPLGEGAIAIIRISGRGSIEIVEKIFRAKKVDKALGVMPSHRMVLGYIVDFEGKILDEVLVCPMRAPNTYTREDLVEIHCHGGIVAVQRIFELVLSMGARMAEPGEFTKRAFLNGRIDLAQAEAVLDIIRARSRMGADLAIKQLGGSLSELVGSLRVMMQRLIARVEAEIDFPEDVEESDRGELLQEIITLIERIDGVVRTEEVGRIYREGMATVLVGKPNVGKSTLLNRLLGEQRAIVTDIPGTTRDIIEETLSIRGIPVRLIDTAGIRKDAGVIERIGIEKAKNVMEQADLIIALFDATVEIEGDDLAIAEMIREKRSIVVLNKIDADVRKIDRGALIELVGEKPVVEISAQKGWGIEELKDEIRDLISSSVLVYEDAVITRKRHKEALLRTRESLAAAAKGLEEGMPSECIAVDLWEAWERLGEITGEALSEDIINRIFEEFCIGK